MKNAVFWDVTPCGSLLKGEDIVRFVKSQRLRWLGHVERMEDNAMPKMMIKGNLYYRRRKGRPRMRWLDDVESDQKKRKIRGWKKKMRERERWRLAVEEAKTRNIHTLIARTLHTSTPKYNRQKHSKAASIMEYAPYLRKSPASDRGGPAQFVWDLWWTGQQ
jgi:hypothetical protein